MLHKKLGKILLKTKQHIYKDAFKKSCKNLKCTVGNPIFRKTISFPQRNALHFWQLRNSYVIACGTYAMRCQLLWGPNHVAADTSRYETKQICAHIFRNGRCFEPKWHLSEFVEEFASVSCQQQLSGKTTEAADVDANKPRKLLIAYLCISSGHF